MSGLLGLVRRGRINLLLVREKGRRLLLLECLRDEALASRAKVRPGSAKADDMLLLPSALTYEAGLPLKARIPGFRAGAVLVINRIGADTVCSFSPRYGSEEPLSIARFYASTFDNTNRSEGPDYGSRSRIGFTGKDFRDLRACLRHYTKG